jgi:diguanylate cyclase (GGDEF)-like protein/PAS domain S-box-containing protein
MAFSLPTLLSSSADLEVLRGLLDLIVFPVFVKDAQHRFVLVNRAGYAILGRDPKDVVGRTDHDLFPGEQADIYVANDRVVLDTGETNENMEVLTDGTGRLRTLLTRKSRLRLPNGEDFVIVCVTDVTEFQCAESQIRHNSEHDALTGCANSVLLRRRLAELLGQLPHDTHIAVVLIHLDRFRNIGHTLNLAAGDNLLIQFAQFLLTVTRPSDLVARLDGEDFAILQWAGQPDAIGTAIAKRLESPFYIGVRPVHMAAASGIALACFGESPEKALGRAELALLHSRRDGRNRWRLFEIEMEAIHVTRPFLEDDLRVALDRNQFSLVYQPIARVSDLHVLGYEALLRWTHPALGAIAPSVFIPLAEAEGVIVEIGEWVMREACLAAARGPKELVISINVSPVQFSQADLPGLVRSVIRESAIDPQRIELELTETSLIGDLEQARRTFADLQAVGVRIVLDDFGAGYSSLEVVKSLPFSKMKIDRSLLQDVGRSEKADAIISAVLRLAATLDLEVVAEGVETMEQLAFLKRERCQAFQGFLLGQPLPNPFEQDQLQGQN